MNDEYGEVECPHCGQGQTEDIENDSFVCDDCGEIFSVDC